MSPTTTPPAPPQLGCLSSLTRSNLEENCTCSQASGTTCPQASIPEQFASVPWNSFSRVVLKALYDFIPVSVHCNKSSAVRFPVRGSVGGLGGARSSSRPPSALLMLTQQQVPRVPALLCPRPHPSPQHQATGLHPKEPARSAHSTWLEKSGDGRQAQTDSRPADGRTDNTAGQARLPAPGPHHITGLISVV